MKMENNDEDIIPPSNSQPPQTAEKMQLIETIEDFKPHPFPLARIKRIMKSNHNVKLVSADAPVFFAKACELFIADLTMRSWLFAEENNRRMLKKCDISTTVARTSTFHFFLDVKHRDETLAADPHPCGGVVPAIVIGTPVVDGSGMYAAQPFLGAWTVAEDEDHQSGVNSGRN